MDFVIEQMPDSREFAYFKDLINLKEFQLKKLLATKYSIVFKQKLVNIFMIF